MLPNQPLKHPYFATFSIQQKNFVRGNDLSLSVGFVHHCILKLKATFHRGNGGRNWLLCKGRK